MPVSVRIRNTQAGRAVAFSLALSWILPLQAWAGITGIQKLDEGLAQFALDTGRPAEALAYTQDLDSEQALLIRSHALRDTGRAKQALSSLERLIDGDYFRGQAALLKAEILGPESEEYADLLELAAAKGHGDAKQSALFKRAEAARVAGEPDRAGQILARMDPGYWAALGYMNIAAEYASQDRTPSRALVALRVAMAMAEEDPDEERAAELNSRLLVRAGHLAYEYEEFDKAIGFLEKIPLEDYSTPQGLYLHGLALSAKGDQRGAMQSWHRAKKFPLAHPGVAEAWLGTGRGYDLAGYLGQAGEAYLAASASYESERVTLRKMAEMVKKESAYKALIIDTGESDAEWYLADNRMLTQPISAYLLRFMEDPDSQKSVVRVRKLEALVKTLNALRHDFVVFQDVIDERLKSTTSPLAGLPSNYGQKLKVLAERVSSRMERGSTSRSESAALRSAMQTIKDLATSESKLSSRLSSRNQRLKALKKKIAEALVALDRAEVRIENTLVEANTALDQTVLAFVEDESQRMVAALEKANQQIAHLYEYLALQNLSRGTTP